MTVVATLKITILKINKISLRNRTNRNLSSILKKHEDTD